MDAERDQESCEQQEESRPGPATRHGVGKKVVGVRGHKWSKPKVVQDHVDNLEPELLGAVTAEMWSGMKW